MGIITTEADLEVRRTGRCPHSEKPCDRARLCALTAPEACVRLITNTVCSCASCLRRGRECRTLFRCFRVGSDGRLRA